MKKQEKYFKHSIYNDRKYGRLVEKNPIKIHQKIQ